MENASKALLIAGAILLCILIIAIGMFIYSSAKTNIDDSITQMSSQSIDAFNAIWENYEGKQSGAQVKSLLGKLISNANTYREETANIPTVEIKDGQISANTKLDETNKIINTPNLESGVAGYINSCGDFKSQVESKHQYIVKFGYSKSGLINKITIDYNKEANTE